MKLELQNVSKRFGDERDVLNGLSYRSEFHNLAVIGPSGCGKSTLLRIIGGLLTPSGGTVALNGHALPQTETALIAYRKQLGFVFQQGGLFRHMTALQNIAVPLMQVHGIPQKQAEAQAMELLARFGLAADADKRPAQLSGGQQQRIAIARAVAPHPKLLLLDEPTSALDPEYTGEVLDVINELRGDGIDFIIVTHEMGFAQRACEQVVFLSEGRIAEAGPSSRLFAAPETEALRRFLAKLLEWNPDRPAGR